MTTEDEYFLTGPLHIVAGTDGARPQCIFVGHRAFHGSAGAATLLRAVAEASTLAGITERFNALDGRAMTVEQAREVLVAQLLPAGLVTTSPAAVPPRSERKSLFPSGTLLSERTVGRLSPLFGFLFSVPAAALAGGTATAILLWWLAARLRAGVPLIDAALAADMTAAEALLFCAVTAATFVLHELGHAAATCRWGQRPAEIGIGLYLIFPVLFSNVTRAWGLSRGRRLAVNLGGIYLQGVATACLVPFQVHGDNPVLALVIVLNLLSLVVNLNPFFRFDGYWIYADLFDLPNLRERSRAWTMRQCARWLGRADAGFVPGEPLALRLYATLAPLFFAAFTLWAAKHALDFYPAFSAILEKTLHRPDGISSTEALLDAAGVWATLAVYMIGYILSGLYIVSSALRAITFMRVASGKSSAKPQTTREAA